MDQVGISKKAKNLFEKYKFVLLILAVGILLMNFPSGQEPAVTHSTNIPISVETTRAEELEEILTHIAGVGKVKVMLSESSGAETVFQTDENHTASADSENKRIETVIISNSGREEEGLVKTITPPTYLGAIIVCQGGDSPTVRLHIVEAVANVTGLSSDRITVLKMK